MTRPFLPLAERLMLHVEKDGTCWNWTGYRGRKGYGRVRVGSRSVLAHRASYEAFRGPIPEGRWLVCHTCDNPKCINPDHLYIGTDADNVRDMVTRGRNRAPRGEQHRAAKLTETQVQEIIARWEAGGITKKTLAAEYGVDASQVVRITRGQTWKSPTRREAAEWSL